MVGHKNCNLSANEACVNFFTPKLIRCFIDGFTLKMKSQSIAYLLNGSEDIDWILDLEGALHSILDLWISGLQKCKGNGFFRAGIHALVFGRVQKKMNILDMHRPCPNLPPR